MVIAIITILLAILPPTASAGAADTQPVDEAIKPDVDIQNLIDQYRHAERWTPEFYQRLTALHELTKQKAWPRRQPGQHGPPVLEEQRHLIRQAAYYYAQTSTPPKEDANGLVLANGSTRGQFKDLMRELRIDDYRVMAALLPYIDTKDQRLRRFILTEVLEGDGQYHGSEEDDNDPIVKAILQYMQYNVQMEKLDTPWTVVQILYWKAPSTSLHYLCKTREKCREAYLADHAIQEVLWRKGRGLLKAGEIKAATAELDKLSQFDDWAVKLYVAEMLRRHEEFRDEKIIERLRADKNSVVAKAIDVPLRGEENKGPSPFGP